MKNKKIITLKTYLISSLLIFGLTACSDDEPKKIIPKNVVSTDNHFDHNHDEATNLEKHKFEHEFAEQCIAREIRNSVNKENDRKRFAKPCLCIAEEMMDDLTTVEAEKFLEEDKNTQSLTIRFEAAAYNCLQEKAKPQEPEIFKRR
ncbi:MAG: hypothetical protein PSN04_04395 [Methyloprofundus sp.]|nr:hypothetical protein [Methyloprofundus sp.]